MSRFSVGEAVHTDLSAARQCGSIRLAAVMTLRTLTPSLAFTVAALAFACGGGESSRPDEIPTATLPNPLPEPVILGQVIPPVDGFAYTVQPGDSLAAIAERFDTTADAIAAANAIADPTRLEIGQVLTIPGIVPEADEILSATAESPPEPGAGVTYTVQSGDVATAIAASFDIALGDLAAANNMTTVELRELAVGEVLVIPPPQTPTPEPALP